MRTIVNCRVLRSAELVAGLVSTTTALLLCWTTAFVLSATPACADIYQWEYVDPADPSQGKRQSTTLAPDGAGVDAVPGADLSNRNLSMAHLQGVDLNGIKGLSVNLTDADLAGATLTNADLRRANLTAANLNSSALNGADLTDATVRGANFGRFYILGFGSLGSGISPAQLYSTSDYKTGDLSGINLSNNGLAYANFDRQNLASADFGRADLSFASFRGANLTNVDFTDRLCVVDFGCSFRYSILAGADFTSADARGAFGFQASSATTANLIGPDGHIGGLKLDVADLLTIRDYGGKGDPLQLLPIKVDQQFAMGPGGTLRIVFEADAWDSTISFAPGIPVTLGGMLELTFAADVNPASQVGRTLKIFDWTGVSPTGEFAVSSPYRWDTSNLYTTGEITLTAIPEPSTFALAVLVLALVVQTRCRLRRWICAPPESLCTSLTQQGPKACLLKVMVGGQRLSNAALLHQEKRNAIRQGPVLIGTLLITLERLLKLLLCGWNHFHKRFGLKTADEARGTPPPVQSRQRIGKFDQHPRRSHQSADASPTSLDRRGMVFVAGVHQGQKIVRVDKLNDHSTLLPVSVVIVPLCQIGRSIDGTGFRQVKQPCPVDDIGPLRGRRFNADPERSVHGNFHGFVWHDYPPIKVAAEMNHVCAPKRSEQPHPSISRLAQKSAPFSSSRWPERPRRNTRGPRPMNLLTLLCVLVVLLTAAIPPAHADIYEWEYIDPADPSQGKRQSMTLAPDGAGVDAVPGADLSNRDLTMAYLTGADLSPLCILCSSPLGGYLPSRLLGTNLTNADLTNANLTNADLTDANFTNAEIQGAALGNYYRTGLTLAHLYSTASYQTRGLSGVGLEGSNLAGGNFSGQNLASARFDIATLTGADFTEANLRNARFYWAGARAADFSRANLANGNFQIAELENANFSQADLSYANFNSLSFDSSRANLAGANLSGANLQHASFSGFPRESYCGEFGCVFEIGLGPILYLANLSGADARGAHFLQSAAPILSGANTTNLIQTDGHINGVDLEAGGLLLVRDYDGIPDSYPPNVTVPITVDQHLTIGPGGTLRMVFESDAWDSTISFALGIPVTLGGTLELTFADDVNLASQVGGTFDLFNWSGVTPTGTFAIAGPYQWDTSNLYTTGEVTVAAVPEPPGFAPVALGVLGLFFRRRRANPASADGVSPVVRKSPLILV